MDVATCRRVSDIFSSSRFWSLLLMTWLREQQLPSCCQNQCQSHSHGLCPWQKAHSPWKRAASPCNAPVVAVVVVSLSFFPVSSTHFGTGSTCLHKQILQSCLILLLSRLKKAQTVIQLRPLPPMTVHHLVGCRHHVQHHRRHQVLGWRQRSKNSIM